MGWRGAARPPEVAQRGLLDLARWRRPGAALSSAAWPDRDYWRALVERKMPGISVIRAALRRPRSLKPNGQGSGAVVVLEMAVLDTPHTFFRLVLAG